MRTHGQVRNPPGKKIRLSGELQRILMRMHRYIRQIVQIAQIMFLRQCLREALRSLPLMLMTSTIGLRASMDAHVLGKAVLICIPILQRMTIGQPRILRTAMLVE